MRPLLFYYRAVDHANDNKHRVYLEKILGVGVEIYPVLDHIENEYDHDNPPPELPGTCWCQVPNPADGWPQLFMNPEVGDSCSGDAKFVAAGDNILAVTLEEIYSKFGKNVISGPGPW